MKTEELIPTNGQKSFNGKAIVISFDDGWKFLKSYKTIVAGIDQHGGKRRFFAGRSATTGRHVSSFFEKYGILIKAKDFFKWPVESVPIKHCEIEEEQ